MNNLVPASFGSHFFVYDGLRHLHTGREKMSETYNGISYDEGVRLIVELRKRNMAQTGRIIAAIHGMYQRGEDWWAQLANDTGYSPSHLRKCYAIRDQDGADATNAAESKHLPRARHAIAQLTPDEAAELQEEFQAKVDRAVPPRPYIPPQPFPQAKPDPDLVRAAAQDTQLLENRSDIATAISLFQRVYERGIDSGHDAIQSDLSRAGKWLAALMSLADHKSLDDELSEFLESDR